MQTSAATLAFLSWARISLTMASLIWSQILSGWPFDTCSDENNIVFFLSSILLFQLAYKEQKNHWAKPMVHVKSY